MEGESPKVGPLFRAAQRMFLLGARLTRGMTLGVRVIALDDRRRVLLVRHTYVRGWHLPGGGVDPGETLEQAARRELREEGGVETDRPLTLRGVCLNRAASRRDHVAVFVADGCRQLAPKTPDREIAEAAFHPLDRLPADATPGTRRRIGEFLAGRPMAAEW